MRYHALASDFDGTLAEHGKVDAKTLAALQRARDAGRKLVLVTGREWPDLRATFAEYKIFHQIVAENGALLVDPETGEETVIATPPPESFAVRLRERGVQPLSVGRVIVATWHPHETEVLEAIRDLGLELQVIFNKGAVMVLPSGVNKASGLRQALERLRISRHNCVAVGDAENDHALLEQSELGVAVANSVPVLKERADWVTHAARGDGVGELIEEWLSSDLYARPPKPGRHMLTLGKRSDGSDYSIPAHGSKLLVCGSSGSGKSTFTGALLEELTDEEYQYCVIDPEGDFQTSPGHVVRGDAEHAPDPAEAVKALSVTPLNIVLNLLGVPLEQRPAFARVLLEKIKAEQEQSGRPHWMVIDEAHHMLGTDADVSPDDIYDVTSSLLLVTVHPERLHDKELGLIDTFVVVGASPRETLQAIARAHHVTIPSFGETTLTAGTALVWSRRNPNELITLSSVEPRQERRRHRRKYAVGELGPDKSFYFRGPKGALNLRAHNLVLFMQVADGVDPDTWSYHLQRSDYSRWLREAVKDHDLADEVSAIERANASPSESRARVRRAIDRRYTLPA